MSGDMSDRMPDGMSRDMPERMSETMSERMSEDYLQSGCEVERSRAHFRR